MNLLNRLNLKPFMAEDGGMGGATPTATAEATPETIIQPDVEKTFTQAEVNDIIEKRLSRERKKFEEEISKKHQETLTEVEKLQNMTESQRREYELNKKLAEYEEREKELNKRALQSETKGILAELGYNSEQIKQLNNFLDYTDAEACKKSIESIDKIIKNLVSEKVQSELNAKLKTVTKPQVATSNNGNITWEQVLENPALMGEYRKQLKNM